METNSVNLASMLDIQNMQKIQSLFSNSTSLAAIVLDFNGAITSESNFSDYYYKFQKQTEYEYKIKKLESPTIIYTSDPASVTSFIIPIFIHEKHIASIFAGQVLKNQLNENDAKKYAKSMNFNEDDFLKELKKLPVMSSEQITNCANLLNVILFTVLKNVDSINKLNSSYLDVFKYTESVKNSLTNFYKTSNELNSNQEELINEIENINSLLIEINSIVKSVSSLADETQMISFNASIEAARAGEQGKSFTVIAGEIRRLSEQSKKTVSNIQNFTANIQKSIYKTANHSKNCMESIKSELIELSSIDKCINKILESLSDKK